MLGIILLTATMVMWILSVTTERGREFIFWTSHFLGTIVLICVMMASVLLSLSLAMKDVGV